MQLWFGAKCLDGEVNETMGQCWMHGFVQGVKEAIEEGKEVTVLVAQLCPTLCGPIDCCLPDCPRDSPGKNTGVGKLFPSPGDLPNPAVEPRAPALWADSLTSETLGKPVKGGVKRKSVRWAGGPRVRLRVAYTRAWKWWRRKVGEARSDQALSAYQRPQEGQTSFPEQWEAAKGF